jgi:PST family polysaccharide transporter
MVVVFTGFAELFVGLGLGAAVVQRRELQQRNLSSAFWASAASGVVFATAIILASPHAASLYGNPALRGLMAVVGINLIVVSLRTVPEALLQRSLRSRTLSWISVVAVVSGAAVAIGLSLLHFGVWSLVGQQLCTTAVSTGLIWRASGWRPIAPPDGRSLRELLSFSSGLLGFNAANYWVRNADNFLIGKTLGPASLGIYARAYSLMLLPVSQITTVVGTVIFPALAALQHDLVRFRRAYLQATRLIALVTFPMMVGAFVLAEPLILFVYGHQWIDCVPIFRILCVSGLIQGVGSSVGWIYSAIGRTGLFMIWGIASGIVYIAAYVIGLQWGAIGVAAAYVIAGYVVIWYPSWTIPGRLIGVTFSDMVANLATTLACAMGMGMITHLSLSVLPAGMPAWGTLSIGVPLGVLAFVLFCSVFRLQAYSEFLAIMRDRLGRSKV